MKTIFSWFNDQIEWIKSFLSEKDTTGGKLIGSSKRVATFVVVYLFAHSVIKTGEGTQWLKLPEVSWEWAVLIGGIIGISVYDSLQKKKLNGIEKNA